MADSNSSSIDFGELANDEAFKSCVSKVHESVDDVASILQLCCQNHVYQKLSPEDKVQYDLFLSYSLNCLFWTYLKTLGVDPAKHSIKNELDRVRSYMARAKQVHERQSMPRIDKEAAERFVTSGLWEPGKPKIKANSKPSSGNGVNKRKKFDSDED